MGWSCAVEADTTLNRITEAIRAANPDIRTSNGMPGGGFFETSRREYDDGAITGTVWRLLNEQERQRWAHLSDVAERVHRAGSFRIDGNGKVKRFPRLSREIIAYAEQR